MHFTMLFRRTHWIRNLTLTLFHSFVNCHPKVSLFKILGSIWIGLVLLKLKTYCWNHCSKIIFKCVNSTVGPIFNEKIDKKWNLWVHEQCMNALFNKKVNICGYCSCTVHWTVATFLQKTREKKKKKKKNEWKRNFTKRRRNKCYPN